MFRVCTKVLYVMLKLELHYFVCHLAGCDINDRPKVRIVVLRTISEAIEVSGAEHLFGSGCKRRSVLKTTLGRRSLLSILGVDAGGSQFDICVVKVSESSRGISVDDHAVNYLFG